MKYRILKRIKRPIPVIDVAYVLIAVIFSLFAYWYLFPGEVLDIHNQPFPVKNKKLHPGDNLEYYIDLCKLKDKSASVTLWLQDGVIVHLPPLENSNIPVACHETWMSLPLPVNLDEGTYKLVQSLDYKVNPVTTINYTVETEEFTVVHNEPTY